MHNSRNFKIFLNEILLCLDNNNFKECILFIKKLLDLSKKYKSINLAHIIYNHIIDDEKKRVDFDKIKKFFENIHEYSENDEVKAFASYIIALLYQYYMPYINEAAYFYFKNFLLTNYLEFKIDAISSELECMEKICEYFEVAEKIIYARSIINKILQKLDYLKSLSDDYRVIYKTYMYIAYFNAKMKRFNLAFFYLNKIKTNNIEILGEKYYYKGLIYSMMGEYKKAISNYKCVLKFEKVRQLENYILFEIGKCYELLKDHKNAIISFEKCLKLLDNDNEGLQTACCYNIEFNKSRLKNEGQ